MTNWLVRLFVKNYEEVTDERVRERYGFLSSLVGIACNILLFLVKYIMGTLANSIAVISDGFNNLSDCASCVITMFGYKMAGKPADKDHPFGHGRMEYLLSLVIAVIIIIVGYNLFTTSIDKTIHPQRIDFNWVVVASLAASIMLKLWMGQFNGNLGRRINSSAMLATSKDSFNDVLATTATIVAVIASLFTDLPVDGAMGILVSLFVLFSGLGIIRETVDVLLGKPADPQMVEEIRDLLTSKQYVLGVHDFVLHNYGPGKMLGSAHVEVPSDQSVLDIHDMIDQAEREIYDRYKIIMTIHMDPIVQNDEKINAARDMVTQMLREIDAGLSIHDFRMVTGPTHTNLIFDILVPFECGMSNSEIEEGLKHRLAEQEITYFLVLTFDRSYI